MERCIGVCKKVIITPQRGYSVAAVIRIYFAKMLKHILNEKNKIVAIFLKNLLKEGQPNKRFDNIYAQINVI